MNGLDVAILIGSVFAFVGGYRRGLVARAVMWLCVVGTMLLAADNMSKIVRLVQGGEVEPSVQQIVLVVGASLVVGRSVGALAGYWIRRRIPTRPLRVADRMAGGAAGVVGIAVTLWLATPVLAFLPGWPAGAVRSSTLATALARTVPVRLDALSAVRNLLRNGGFPIAVSEIGRSFDAGSPPESEVLTRDTRRMVVASVVRVTSVGCGAESIGTGFVVGSGQVLTAAHVVAGAKAVAVESDAIIMPVTIVAFDPAKDLALLQSAQGRIGPSLVLQGTDAPGETGADREVFGYFDGGPLRVRSVRSSTAMLEVGRDIFDELPVKRDVLRLAADLGPGDSGAPVVDRAGEVTGLVFSRAPDRATTAFALGASELRRFLLERPTAGSAARCLPMRSTPDGEV